MKKEQAPWVRIKRKQQASLSSYRERKKSHAGPLIIIFFILAITLLTVLQVPERIGMISKPSVQEASPALELTGIYKHLLAEITDSKQDMDWDGDGLKNGADPYPREIDADRNGISDGYEGKTIISGALPIKYENVRMVVSNTQSGVVRFRGDYFFSAYAGWASFENVSGTPYVYRDNRWTKAECEWIDRLCYVNIPGSCRLRFTDSGKPDDRDVLIDAVSAKFDNKPDDRYSIANAPLSQLTQIYTSIDNGKTVQVSIITDAGEQILLVHGYDKYGNLIVAECDSLADAGKINIQVCSQVFWDGRQITMRSWFEFRWGELSSENGNIFTSF